MPGRTVWVSIGFSAQRTCLVIGREEFGLRVDTGFGPSGEDWIGADAVGSGGSAHTSSGARMSLDMIGSLRSILVYGSLVMTCPLQPQEEREVALRPEATRAGT